MGEKPVEGAAQIKPAPHRFSNPYGRCTKPRSRKCGFRKRTGAPLGGGRTPPRRFGRPDRLAVESRRQVGHRRAQGALGRTGQLGDIERRLHRVQVAAAGTRQDAVVFRSMVGTVRATGRIPAAGMHRAFARERCHGEGGRRHEVDGQQPKRYAPCSLHRSTIPHVSSRRIHASASRRARCGVTS